LFSETKLEIIPILASEQMSNLFKEAKMPGKKNEVTSKKAASAASKVLSNPNSSKLAKTAAASALTQRPGKK
jgi:hypothetical protein